MCGVCRQCKKNAAHQRSTGLPGPFTCSAIDADTDVVLVDGEPISYTVAAVQEGRPAWHAYGDPRLVYLWFCRRFAQDVMHHEGVVMQEAEAQANHLESVLMELNSGAYNDEDILDTDLIHAGAGQQVQARVSRCVCAVYVSICALCVSIQG